MSAHTTVGADQTRSTSGFTQGVDLGVMGYPHGVHLPLIEGDGAVEAKKVTRGFRRLGIVLAAPVFLAGMIALIAASFFAVLNHEVKPFVEGIAWAGGCFAIAALLFCSTVSIGWVVAGFCED